MIKKLVVLLGLVVALNCTGGIVQAEEEEVFTFDEVVVTASKYEEQLSETPVSMEVVDQEEIQQKNAQNAADLLRDVASVQINDEGGIAGKKSISIRGSDSNQVLILIDGQAANEIQGGGFDLSLLSTTQIERIEILKGPASVTYGANALGGVINIITKTPSLKPETIFELGFGSDDTQSYNLRHSNQVGSLGYNVIAKKISSDGHRENSSLDQNNFFSSFKYQFSEHLNSRLALQYDDTEKGVPGSLSHPSPNADQKDEIFNLNLTTEVKTNNSDATAALYWRNGERDYKDPDLSTDDLHERDKLGINFDQTIYFANNDLTYGLEVEKQKVQSTKYNQDYELTNTAFFIQDKWDLSSDLNINLGSRYDDNEEYGSEISPRLGFVYDINPQFSWYSSVGKAYRAPTYDDLYPDYGWFVGNQDLKPETAISYESGVRFNKDDLQGEVSVFYRDVSDLIKYVDDVYPSTMKNVDSAEIKGVEFSCGLDLTDTISNKINYTYLDARNDKTNARLDNKPYHNLNLGMNYDHKQFSSSVTGELVAGRADNLPSYFVTDFKLQKELTETVNISFEINNLFDREYQVQDGYPMPERNFMINTEIKF